MWLETIEIKLLPDGLEKQTTKRINLEFIVEGDEAEEAFFDPKDAIENNARKFINDFSPYSIINTTDLFSDAACDRISKKHNTFGVDR